MAASTMESLPIPFDAASIMENLKCQICLDLYDDPRMMSCGHTFCANCLRQVVSLNENSPANSNSGDEISVQTLVKCPTCRHAEVVNFTQMDTPFPKNFEIARLIEAMGKTKRAVLITGQAGAGKASLGQLLLNKCEADMQDSLAVNEGSGFVLLDKVEIANTSDEATEKLIDELAKTNRGIDILIFAFSDAISDDVHRAFMFLMQLMGKDLAHKANLILVKTKSKLQMVTKEKQQLWIQRASEDSKFKEIYDLAGQRLVFIDVDRDDEDLWRASRKSLIAALKPMKATRFFPEMIIKNKEEFDKATTLLDQLAERVSTPEEQNQVDAMRLELRKKYLEACRNGDSIKFTQQPAEKVMTYGEMTCVGALVVGLIPVVLLAIPAVLGGAVLFVAMLLPAAVITGCVMGIRRVRNNMKLKRQLAAANSVNIV